MTISKYIVDFLNQIGGISIDTNHVRDGSDQYGLFKSPSRDKKDFTDDSYEVTEYYQFLARLDSVSDSERKEAPVGYSLDTISFVASFCLLWFRLVDSVFHGCTGIFYLFSILRDMIRFLRKFLCVSCIFLLLASLSMFMMMHLRP